MKKLFQERNICFLFRCVAIVMFGLLFYYCLGQTSENKHLLWDEFTYIKQDSVLVNALLLIGALFALTWIRKLSFLLASRKRRNIILTLVCIFTGIFSIYWVYACKVGPGADQLFICQYADAFNQGDFRGFNRGIYIARYPQQLGMITLLRVLFMMFGETNYLAFQYLSAALVPLMVLAGSKIVRYLSDNNATAELFFYIFIVLCFPMYAYTAFVYGDLISVVFTLLGVWMYLACQKQFTIRYLILFGVFMGIAVLLRQNILIVVVALGIVTIVKFIFHRTKENVFLLLSLVLGVFLFQAGIWLIYRNVRQEDAEAIPSILFVVMGLNDDYQHAGWHNNYEYETFGLLNDDVEAAKQKGWEDLKMYINMYRNDPDYMIDFFTRKMNLQWNAPMYQGIAMNAGEITGEQLSPVKEIYEFGKLTRCIEVWMKLYQLLLYGSILYWLLMSGDKNDRIEKYVLLVAVFGGFLFSLMWEAKTRYVMPYLFMMLPYMALGLVTLTDRIQNLFCKNNDKIEM